MNSLLDSLRTWLFLRHAGVQAGRGIVLQGLRNIQFGRRITLADGVKIRSRSDNAKISVGSQTHIRDHVEVNAKGDAVTIGSHCFLANGVWVGGFGEINIGHNTIVGIRSIIVSSDHDYMQLGTPYYDVAEIRKPIMIGENVWVGSNCVILGGSIIGSGSVIGAGSVVTGHIPANSLVVGRAAEVKCPIER